MTISVHRNSETNCGNSDRPIIILGCPRSGTLLVSRVIGGSDKHFLITEHSNKAKHCSEDKSGINDALLWWKNFEYLLWDSGSDRPLVETPVYSRDHLEKVKRVYLEQAKSKRLVLKNPVHLKLAEIYVTLSTLKCKFIYERTLRVSETQFRIHNPGIIDHGGKATGNGYPAYVLVN